MGIEDDYILNETPDVDVMPPEEEPEFDNEEEPEEKESLREKAERARDIYERVKKKPEGPPPAKEVPEGEVKAPKGEEPLKGEVGKQGVPEAEAGKASKAPSELKGEIGKPITPKAPPAGAGAAGEAGGAAAGGAEVAGGAAGTAGGAAGTAGSAAGGATGAVSGTAGAAGGAAAAWEVIAVIVIILIIIGIVLFIVGFVIGLVSGGKLNKAPSGYSGEYITDTAFIPVEGKYFPISVKPSANFDKGSGRGFGDWRDGGTRHHAGNDFLTVRGTPVRAIADGVIVNYYYFYRCSGGPSYALIVDHGDFVANYGEIEPGLVGGIGIGSRVTAGQVIAHTDGCGMLHFEMYTPGTTRNSAWYPGNKPSNLLDPTSFTRKLLEGFK